MPNLDRLKLLRDVTIPHLRNMPKAEEFYTIIEYDGEEFEFYGSYNGSDKTNSAILNFNCYIEDNRGFKKEENLSREISDKYDCGYEGCLAGWHFLLQEQAGAPESELVKNYSVEALAEHFDISRSEAMNLFSSAGLGVEDGISLVDYTSPNGYTESFDADMHEVTSDILEERAGYLDRLIALAEGA